MNRASVMLVSAAVVGALLAVGVTALAGRGHGTVHFSHDVEVKGAEARVEREIVRKVLRGVRNELRSVGEGGDRELTDAEREQLRQAMEQLDAQLPLDLGLAELLEGITEEDGSAHKDSVAADAPEPPALTDTPAPAAGSSGN